MFSIDVDDLSILVVTGECARLKGNLGQFAGRRVLRGLDDFLAHRSS